jgi:large subunit ribosomal protein L24
VRIKKNDVVVVISGAERGRTGKVLKVFPGRNMVLVEKVRLIKRHTRRGRHGSIQGGIIEKEAPIHVSNVAVVDPKTSRPTRVRHRVLADGTRERTTVKSGAIV